jgi:branched-chain amino acid transport system substrate-binding protein
VGSVVVERTRLSKSTTLRAIAAATVATSVVVVAVACGGSAPAPSSSASASPAPIRIGAVYDLTGAQAALDAPSLDGARLAVDRINAAGGLLGRRVELLERDGQSSPAVARAAARSLVRAGASAIIGLSDTDQVLAAAPVAARARIPFLTSGATSPLLPAKVPDWLFMASFGDNVQAAAGAEYARQSLRAGTAAIIYDTAMEYTRELQHYFSESFRAQHGRIVLDKGFHPTSDDVGKVLAALTSPQPIYGGSGEADGPVIGHTRPVRPDLLYVAVGPLDAALVLRELRAAGYVQRVMGGDSYDTEELFSAAQQTGGGVTFTTQAAFGIAHSTAAMRRFAHRYEAAYGRAPENSFAGLGYDAVNLVAHAIVTAKSADPAAIRDALAATRGFHGVTGTVSLAHGGATPRRQVAVVDIDSRPRLAAVITPQFVPRP